MQPLRSTVVIGLAAAALGLARAEAPQEHRQHGTHEHGVATLRLAQEGGDLRLELSSPAANLVGFEHAPANAAERDALERAIATLKDGTRLFRFPEGAGCRLTEAQVETPLLGQGGSEPQGGHPHPAHEHEHEHEAEHADEHDHEHGDAHREGSESGEAHDRALVHADIDAVYSFVCAKPEAVKGLEVGLFTEFPATHRVQLEYVLAAGQGARVLTADAPSLRL
jgi:hypothetical protein